MQSGFWLRWSWRDLRARWLQVAAIALVIALGAGTYAGLTSTAAWRKSSYDASYEALRVHDLLVTLAEGTTVDGSALDAALKKASDRPWFADASPRLVVPTQVDATGASPTGETILVPGRLVGVELAGGGPSVDGIDTVEGAELNQTDDGAPVVQLDYHFAKHFGLPARGSVLISGGHAVDYVGQAISPQYFMITSGTGSYFGEAAYAVMFAPLASVQDLASKPGQVNEAGVRLAPGADVDAARAELEQILSESLPGTATQVTPLGEERQYRVMYDDIRGDQRLYDIFAVLIMAGAAFAAFNLTGRIVEAQRREIGIGMSLGVPSRRIAVRPMLVALQVSLLGVLLGMGVGLVVGWFMAGLLRSFFPLPVWLTDFQPATFARGAALGLLLTFVATLYPVIRAVRVSPLEAIQTGPRATRTGGLARLVRGLPLPGDSLVQMPLRNVLRAPRRTLLTALGIAAAIATLVGVVGMVDSFVATIGRGEQEVLRGTPGRLTVQLQGFAPTDSSEVRALSSAQGVETVEPMLQIPVPDGLSNESGTHFDVIVDVIDFDSRIWQPGVVEGSLASDVPAVVISEKAARDLGVGPGDTVQFKYPVRDGAGYHWTQSPVPVAGIHPNPYRFLVFLDYRHANLMNLAGIANGAQVAPDPGVSSDQIKRTLFAEPGVASVQSVSTIIDTIRRALSQFLDVLNVVRAAVLLLAMLIAFNSSSIGSDERAREHATMFAFGVPTRSVLLMAMAESAVVGVIATVLGVGAGIVLVQWMVRVLLPSTVPDLDIVAHIAPSTYVTAVVLGVVVVALAPLLTMRKLRRMDIPSTLRVVE